jgi:hypothetical protein
MDIHHPSTWIVYRLAKGSRFSRISKEPRRQGLVYCLFDIDRDQPCWVSQSIPACVEAINRTLTRRKRLHASSCYKITRGESHCNVHKNHHVLAFERHDIDGVNGVLANFPALLVVTQDVTVWFLDDEAMSKIDDA